MSNKFMLSKKDIVYLKHIRDAIVNIENYLKDRTYKVDLPTLKKQVLNILQQK